MKKIPKAGKKKKEGTVPKLLCLCGSIKFGITEMVSRNRGSHSKA